MRLGVGLLVAGMGSGCAAIHSADGTRIGVVTAEFPEYVARVFRDQNRVATELGFALEAPALDPARRAELAQHELALLTTCAPLNELAVAQRDGVQLGRRDALRRARHAPLCEATAAQAANALAGAEPPGP